VLAEGVLIKYRKYTKARKNGRQAGDSARVTQGGDLGPESRAMVSVAGLEFARWETLLPPDLDVVKPEQEYWYGSPIAFQSCKSMLIAGASFTRIFNFLWLLNRSYQLTN